MSRVRIDSRWRAGTLVPVAPSPVAMQTLSIISLVLCLWAAPALVQAGGASSDWWSLQPLGEFDSAGSIDRFVKRSLAEHGLELSPPAPRRTLARRVSFDLTGLPPSPGRLDALERDPRPDAYARYVDELLASDAYGERWARHWLDVVRFGESNGFEYNEPRRNAWPYRDWVIDALNQDMPYDAFVRAQISGDNAAALGFLVAGVHNTVMGASDLMKRQARADELEEIVGTLSQAFLGITAQCARCHDHKLDPVPTGEYYQLAAAVSGVNFGTAASQPIHTVVSGDPGVMRVHVRGNAGELGEEVAAGGISAIRGLSADFGLDPAAPDGERRAELARWITDPNNPLFARAIVNRVWHYHFGTGIAATPNDLGRGGGYPSHPGLLDWLALRFREDGYSLKNLHRLIVTSETYRQSSAADADAMAMDSGSRLLWRFPPRRIEAEVLRDAMLEVAGALNRKMGGPGFEDVREEAYNAGRYYHPIDPEGPEFERRSIYRFSPRGGRSALLDTFDCPDPSATAPRRSVTTTPLQALTLQNNTFVWRMADRFAQRLASEADPVSWAWQSAIGRRPDVAERALAQGIMDEHGLAALCRALFNSGDFSLIE